MAFLHGSRLEEGDDKFNSDQNPLVNQFKDQLEKFPPGGRSVANEDIRKFLYSAKENKLGYFDDVFDKFWKPLIQKYISEYGFMGVRIDAVKQLDPLLVQKICVEVEDCCNKLAGCRAVILGELMHHNPGEFWGVFDQSGLTHILNNSAHFEFTVGARRLNKTSESDGLSPYEFVMKKRKHPKDRGWNHGDNLLENICEFRKDMLSSGGGGTIGYSGNHDVGSLAVLTSVDNLVTDEFYFRPGQGRKRLDSIMIDEEHLPQKTLSANMAKEKLFGILMASDSGWYMLVYDEFLAPRWRLHGF